MQFIDLKKQYELIKSDVLQEINEVLDSGQFIMGDKIKRLETELEQFVGAKHCIGVADGTKALLIALMALDIGPDDEVIVPAFTFIATASMIVLLGAKPVFVDVEPKTYNIDVSLIEAAITPRTKAIIPVDLYGQCADITSINIIAKKHNIAVIEDAAQSFGAKQNGKRAGSLATISCTSFFPSKPLGCYGDGGACFTDDDKLAEKMRQIRVHGQDKRYHHAILGVNGRLDTLQAAILLAKLRVFPKEIELREQIGARYSQLFEGANCITPWIMPGNFHVFAQYTIRVKNRDELLSQLSIQGIPTTVHYPIPLHHQPILVKYYNNQDLKYSEILAKEVISLPMHPYLDEKTQEYIVDSIKKYL